MVAISIGCDKVTPCVCAGKDDNKEHVIIIILGVRIGTIVATGVIGSSCEVIEMEMIVDTAKLVGGIFGVAEVGTAAGCK